MHRLGSRSSLGRDYRCVSAIVVVLPTLYGLVSRRRIDRPVPARFRRSVRRAILKFAPQQTLCSVPITGSAATAAGETTPRSLRRASSSGAAHSISARPNGRVFSSPHARVAVPATTDPGRPLVGHATIPERGGPSALVEEHPPRGNSSRS
jgi:hypothetical protein